MPVFLIPAIALMMAGAKATGVGALSVVLALKPLLGLGKAIKAVYEYIDEFDSSLRSGFLRDLEFTSDFDAPMIDLSPSKPKLSPKPKKQPPPLPPKINALALPDGAILGNGLRRRKRRNIKVIPKNLKNKKKLIRKSVSQ